MTRAAHPLVIAHRGASGYRPEHTRAAYELAFALGADAVEPDLVPSKDGVLVVRHENEISGTTDVAGHPEFAHLRTTKRVAGRQMSGWFTEDFTWAELATLRCRERLPRLRRLSASFDNTEGMLRLSDLLALVDAQSERHGREFVVVAELKHAHYFGSIGLPLDDLFAREVAAWASPTRLIIESFEQTVLRGVRARGVPGRYVFLAEASHAPADLVARDGSAARNYAEHLTDAGLALLATEVDGVSVDKSLLADGVGDDLVGRAHAAGLLAFTWTLRAENRFLPPALRLGGTARDVGDWRTEFGQILDTGVDGVFADQPDLLRSALSAR